VTGPIQIGSESQCTFGMDNNGNSPGPGIFSWRDALWIQAYNGAPNGYYLTWENNPNDGTPTPRWKWNQYNNENPPVDYVLAVCSRQP
jgi:hypothetical protein